MKYRHLGEVARIERRSVEPKTLTDETPYLGLENIAPGGQIITYSTVGVAQPKSNKFAFESQHVLFGKLRPNLAKVTRVDRAGVCSTDILPIRPGPGLDGGYLTHFLLQPSVVTHCAVQATGANLPRLSPSALETIVIPIPSLEEQRRVADILDEATSLRQRRMAAMALVEKAIVSVFERFFADQSRELVPLEHLADKVVVGHVGPTSEYFRAGGVPLLRTANVGHGKIVRENMQSVTQEFHNRQRKSQLRAGDVLVSRVVTDEVRAAILPSDLDDSNCANVIIVRPSKTILPQTILGFLSLHRTQTQLLGRRVGSAQAVVNTTVLKRLPVPNFPIVRQRQLADEIGEILDVEGQAESSLGAMNELIASLQDRAFRGDH